MKIAKKRIKVYQEMQESIRKISDISTTMQKVQTTDTMGFNTANNSLENTNELTTEYIPRHLRTLSKEKETKSLKNLRELSYYDSRSGSATPSQ